MEAKLFQHISRKLQALENCYKHQSTHSAWIDIHTDSIESLVDGYMPSGSGVDSGTKLDFDDSKPNKLVFTFSYHHMNENGYYDGWTEHKCIVMPSLAFGIDIKITGSNRNDIKDYLYDVFEQALNTLVTA